MPTKTDATFKALDIVDNRDDLCVCLTPLHVLIASRIAEHRGNVFKRGIYIVTADQAKQRHYFEKMRAFCSEAFYHVLPEHDPRWRSKHLGIWISRIRALLQLKQPDAFHAVYAPSSVNQNLFALLSIVRFSKLVTYDDGLLNVHPNPPEVFVRTKHSTKIFLTLSGITYWPERVKEHSVRHYTIYDTGRSHSRTQLLSLFPKKETSSQNNLDQFEETSIFIGPYPEASEKVWEAVKSSTREINPTFYLPHPREKYHLISGVAYLKTNLIAEDYVSEILRENMWMRVRVYGYDSAALANLAKQERVTAFSVMGRAGADTGTQRFFESLGVKII